MRSLNVVHRPAHRKSVDAYLRGTTFAPTVELTFGFDDVHATTNMPLREWVKTLPGRAWDGDRKVWVITATGPDPDAVFRDAGFVPVGPDGEPVRLAGLTTAVAVPRKGDVDHLAEVHPRLGGVDAVRGYIGPEAMWLKEESCWLITPSRLTDAGHTVPWADVHPDIVAWQAAHPDAGTTATLPPLVYDGTLDGLRQVPIVELTAVTQKSGLAFGQVGVTSVYDLLHHVPFRYVDLSSPVLVREAPVGEAVAILGKVTKVTPAPQRGDMAKCVVKDRAGTALFVRWFNAGWAAKQVSVGADVLVFGKVETFSFSDGGTGYGMSNPDTEINSDTSARMIGVYPASGKHELTTWQIRSAAHEAANRLGHMVDPVPADMVAARGLMARRDAYRCVHDPADPAQAVAGRSRMAYDELLRLQLALAISRAAQQDETAIQHTVDGSLTGQLRAALPFALTGAQERCIAEITADLSSRYAMHRLLQGDVGSGKTVVIVHAALSVAESGHQSAVIVPTETLAVQHWHEVGRLVSGITRPDGRPIRVELLTNKVTGKARKAVLAGLADGSVDIVVGTHALLADAVTFASLGLAVVDEQHRFGVEQRAALRSKGRDILPDTLYASATPIPRTAVMTVFGDLSLSVLDELPAGRQLVTTTAIPEEDAPLYDRAAPVWAKVRAEVAAGHQAFVVCPLVSESATREAAAAHVTAESLALGALAGLRVGVVTGKDNPADRTATMEQFAAGDLDVLVATTVIEVGINVPNATVMVILGAHKFGLSQLHQLRGRVGRANLPGTCYLVATARTSAARERIEAMCSTTDGFVLAERDLAIRGVGTLLGADQSGVARDLRVADLVRDADLLAAAKADAVALVGSDPHMTGHGSLRSEVFRSVGDEGARWLASA